MHLHHVMFASKRNRLCRLLFGLFCSSQSQTTWRSQRHTRLPPIHNLKMKIHRGTLWREEKRQPPTDSESEQCVLFHGVTDFTVASVSLFPGFFHSCVTEPFGCINLNFDKKSFVALTHPSQIGEVCSTWEQFFAFA